MRTHFLREVSELVKINLHFIIMQLNKNAWDDIFKKEGRFFDKPHKDLPGLVKILKKNKSSKILDLGCGSGRHVVYLAKKGFEVYGIDISKVAIDMSQKWLKEEGLSAELSVQDMTKGLPFTNEFFDAVISFQVIHHAKIEIIKQIVREVERVLKKGGLVFVTVPIYSGPMKRSIKGGWKMKLIATRTYIPLDGKEKGLPHHFFTTDELKKVFGNFKIIKTYFDNTNHYCLLAFKKG